MGVIYNFDIKVVIYSDGIYYWYVLIEIKSICKIDIIYFLFDE